MEIKWIEAFIAVAEELHFGRAADRLHMAQSPLSQTIRKLERSLGSPLFERNTRTVSLTAAGHSFLPHARKIMEELDLARQATRAGSGGVYGKVIIGFSGALNHLTLPPLTRALRAQYPNVGLSLVDRVLTGQAVEGLRQGTLDLAFVGIPLDTSGVSSRLILEEPMGAVLPADHPLAGQAEVDLELLAGEDFVAMPLNSGSVVRTTMFRAAAQAGFQPRVIQEVTDPFLILSLVGAGIGISIVPDCMKFVLPAGTAFVPLSGEPRVMRSGIAWNPERVSHALAAVLDLAEKVLPTPGRPLSATPPTM